MCWIASALAGLVLGLIVAWLIPASAQSTAVAPAAAHVIQTNPDGTRVERLADGTTVPLSLPLPTTSAATPPASSSAAHPAIPFWLCIPFAALLVSFAIMPLAAGKFWKVHYPDVAFALGALVLGYYLGEFGAPGRHDMLHAAVEYYSFIALVGGLYVVSGGILIDIRGRATPLRNTLLLGAGCILANIVGTTGASVLLIRPFMRMNSGRLRPIHVVFFIFIVANCAGALTPVGDPPLYLGFLKGVPFFWTLEHMWPMWLLVNGLLLAMFFAVDSFIPVVPKSHWRASHPFGTHERVSLLAGWRSILFLALLVAGVFIDPLLQRVAGISGYPIGATFQVAMAGLALRFSRPSIRRSNQLTFGPVKEVAILFAGIFLGIL